MTTPSKRYTEAEIRAANKPTAVQPQTQAPFQPLKQSRAMEIAQSRIRADFAPVSVNSKVAEGWRR